ncbi:LysR family transcriptional regulator [Phreatobacter sp.]|uniref:LysR family transcriptional regulator n=1 Tax=Phreatobacter sp. TaxID=1966341 RepID=UPI003F72C72E
MLDLNDLALFAAVVRHEGFSPAGRALGLPKSKLSKHVARLEARLGIRLIERSTRRFRVTETGEEVYQQCQAMLAGAEAAEAAALRARAKPSGVVRVACPPDFGHNLMARIIPDFMQRNPAVKVQLNVSNRRVDLIEERIDIALRVRTRLDTEPDLTLRILGQSRSYLVASPGFVARQGGAIGIDRLPALPTLTHAEGVLRDHWMLTGPDGQPHDLVHEPVLACGDFVVLRQAALDGLGVALLPDQVCQAELDAGRLVQLLPEWSTPFGTIHMVFGPRRGLLPAVRALIDHIVAEYPRVIGECARHEASSRAIVSDSLRDNRASPV